MFGGTLNFLQKTAVRFMDTMSMAIPMFGMADHQVVTYEADDSDFALRVCADVCECARSNHIGLCKKFVLLSSQCLKDL